MKSLATVILFCTLICPVYAEPPADEHSTRTTVLVEDLTQCMFPHDIQKLPEEGSSEVGKVGGYIFSFANRRLSLDPFRSQDKRPTSFADLRRAIVSSNAGDVFFDYADGKPFLVVMGGRANDLGHHLLRDFNRVDLPPPSEVSYVEADETVIGAIPVQLGHCYLLTTHEGHRILARVVYIESGGRSLAIQWVQHSPGALRVDIPELPLIELPPEYRPQVIQGTKQPRPLPPAFLEAIGDFERLSISRRVSFMESDQLDSDSEEYVFFSSASVDDFVEFRQHLLKAGWTALQDEVAPSELDEPQTFTRHGREMSFLVTGSYAFQFLYITIH